MIQFIDINTGNVFNGDIPYIHWFEGKQSINLNYSKNILFISNSSSVTVDLDSECFFLVNPDKLIEQCKLNDKNFYDLSKITEKTITLSGVQYENIYIYSFNIIVKGIYAGSVTEEFAITDTEKHTYTIGADFYIENESLSINLSNIGIEMSNQIQRAIYDKDIYEDYPDYSLLNRKYKELLNENINILGNKGSYKSLINSLKWFEYGDLTKIYEYWRHNEPNKSYLSNKDITQYVNSETSDLLTSMQKTTYIGISCAMQKIKKYSTDSILSNAKIINASDMLVTEPVPELEYISSYWTKSELALKMTLLHNFYSTYFLPIHLDLIHTTIEDIIYTPTIKYIATSVLDRFDTYDNINQFDCTLEKVYHLANVETFTNLSTPFGFIHNTEDKLNTEDSELSHLGVDTYLDKTVSISCQAKTYALQHYKGIGAVIPIHCILYNVFGSCTIKEGEIKIYKNSTFIAARVTDKISHIHNENNQAIIDFNILLKETGDYKIQITFTRSDGVKYIKVLNFSVDEEIYQTLDMYKLVPKYSAEYMKSARIGITGWLSADNTDVIDYTDMGQWVLDPVHNEYEENKVYTQFIYCANNTSNLYDMVHTNSVIILKAPYDFVCNKNYCSNWLVNDLTIKESLKDKLENKGYVCMYINRFGEIKTPEDTKNYIVEFSGEQNVNVQQIGSDTVNIQNLYFFIFIRSTFTDYSTEKDKIKFVGEYTNELTKSIKFWNRECFIPYFYKLVKVGETAEQEKLVNDITDEDIYKRRIAENTYTVKRGECVCFLPSLHSIRKPQYFQWKFICKSTNDEITPKVFRSTSTNTKNDFPTILSPLFGRYDFANIPDAGYYDVILQYKVDDSQDENDKIVVSSQFIYEK
jgi:hypothetical protein